MPRVRLGCVLPDESIASFTDALTRLSDRSGHLYVDGLRYWFAVDRNVVRSARDKADNYLANRRADLHTEVVRRLRAQRERGDLRGVHIAPVTSADVPDEPEARLVILAPDVVNSKNEADSPAIVAAMELLERRGSSPRQFRNMLVFLAVDQRRSEELLSAVAAYLAWADVNADINSEQVSVDGPQGRLAKTKLAEADATVSSRLFEAYTALLVPAQGDPAGRPSIDVLRAEGSASTLALRVSQRLTREGSLYTSFPPALLRQQLDTTLSPLWQSGHLTIGELWSAFARYVYLPRLTDIGVLVTCVPAAVSQLTWETDGVALADGVDAESRYIGLTMGAQPVAITANTMIVNPAVAVLQKPPLPPEDSRPQLDPPAKPGAEELIRRRFHASPDIDALRLLPIFRKLADEIILNLAGRAGARVRVTVEIQAVEDDGFPDDLVRAVSENARVLNVDHFGFEVR